VDPVNLDAAPTDSAE